MYIASTLLPLGMPTFKTEVLFLISSHLQKVSYTTGYVNSLYFYHDTLPMIHDNITISFHQLKVQGNAHVTLPRNSHKSCHVSNLQDHVVLLAANMCTIAFTLASRQSG